MVTYILKSKFNKKTGKWEITIKPVVRKDVERDD